jgi:hypothetical protein
MNVAELTAAKADVVSGLNSASEQLRQALFDGKPTAEIRAFLTEMKERLDAIERDLLAAQAEQEAAEVRKVQDIACNLAVDVAHRLKVRLETLQPPPTPVSANAG